ncbi:C40 family peptidase [Nocardia sp. NPDC004068]|uniref:C40 family peptidase n=1 Tax=Nocardia sp. NPDC004068 TaxID=3364303 RepID=UPI0036B748D4
MNRVIAAAAGVSVAFLSLILILVVFLLDDDFSCTPGGPTLGQGLPDVNGVSMAGLNTSQLQIAKLAVQVGEQRHITENAIKAALLAAAQESRFRNYGNSAVPESLAVPHDGVGSDYDSVGPWQMRASVWGKDGIAKLMDPSYQVDWFYDQLQAIDGWQSRPADELAADVENPRGDLRGMYGPHQEMADQLYQAFKGSGDRAGPDMTGGSCGPGAGTQTPPKDFNARVLAAAQRVLGTEYVWGGGDANGPTGGGFDCSGLVLYAVAQASNGQIKLPHYTQSQQDDPRGQVIPRDAMAPGDIIYFTSPGAHDSHHVGIYAGNGQILHAPETGDVVKYSPLTALSGEQWDVRRFGTDSPPPPAADPTSTGSPSSTVPAPLPGGPHD